MTVRLAQASHDERGAYSGGQAGNQTGTELNIRSWYNRPWDTVIRAKNGIFADRIAVVAQRLCACNRIGYDQSQRTTLYDACDAIGWDINKLDYLPLCECDCSSLIAVILRFCGLNISKYVNTSTLVNQLQPTGLFDILRDSKYLTSGDYLLRGDLVLNTWHHVAVCLDNGAQSAFKPYAALVAVQSFLQVREGPGSQYLPFGVSNGDGTFTSWRLPPNARIQIVEENGDWGRVGNTIGWVSLRYITKI